MRKLADIVYNRNPLTMPPKACVRDACVAMHEVHADAVLVTDPRNRLIGIFTDRDAVCRVLAAGKNADTTTLDEVMTTNPDTLAPDTSAIEALRLMWDGGYRHIPVVDGGRLLGVVSRADFKAAERDRLEVERELWEHMR
jgi:CBS domain-containing protein